jgi:hypothetical protein
VGLPSLADRLATTADADIIAKTRETFQHFAIPGDTGSSRGSS